MRNTLAGLVRLLGALALYLIVGVLLVPTWIAGLITGAGLAMIEPLKDRADELLRTGRGR